MRVKFTLGYGFEPTPELLAALNAVVEPPVELGERDGKQVVKSWAQHEADLEQLLDTGIAPMHVQLLGTGEPRPLRELAEVMRALVATVERAVLAPPPVNDRVHVAVPGNALLRIKQVEVITDACTQHLQEHLDAGWRILAICPQPNQRRPDYVLGRAK